MDLSDIPDAPTFDLRAILAEIDRDRAETQKLFAAQGKLLAEQGKILAEDRNSNRDIWIVPFTILGGILIIIIARLPEILHAFGVGR